MLRTLLAFLLILPATFSYADWSVGIGVGDRHERHDRHGEYRWHDHPRWGYHAHHLPIGYTTIWAGSQRYYYYDGLYYSYVGNGDYVIVDPPIGAYVSTIPPDFAAMYVNGRMYYTSDGIYYVHTPRGYRVVPSPVVYTAPVVATPMTTTTVVTTPPAAPPVEVAQDSFPINVPNNSGGYTTVVVKRSGKGYVGPQGEFYNTFPTVSQLKAMYVK